VHTRHYSTWEAEAEGSPVQGQPISKNQGLGSSLVVEHVPGTLKTPGSIPASQGFKKKNGF
jgi:hypothetical protein